MSWRVTLDEISQVLAGQSHSTRQLSSFTTKTRCPIVPLPQPHSTYLVVSYLVNYFLIYPSLTVLLGKLFSYSKAEGILHIVSIWGCFYDCASCACVRQPGQGVWNPACTEKLAPTELHPLWLEWGWGSLAIWVVGIHTHFSRCR